MSCRCSGDDVTLIFGQTQTQAPPPGADGPPPTDPTYLDASIENYGRVIIMPDVAFATYVIKHKYTVSAY